MPAYAYEILVVGWVAWFTPFFLVRRGGQKAKQVDKRARWGMLIVMIAYVLLWQGKFWLHSPEAWRGAACVLFFAIAAVLSWTATRALGNNGAPFDCKLSSHLINGELRIQTGPQWLKPAF